MFHFSLIFLQWFTNDKTGKVSLKLVFGSFTASLVKNSESINLFKFAKFKKKKLRIIGKIKFYSARKLRFGKF